MRKQSFRQIISLVLIGLMLTGCVSNPALSYLGDADLEYYRSDAERISYPRLDEVQSTAADATFAKPPRHLGDRNHDEIWKMPLAEAIHLALLNNKLLKVRGNPGTSPFFTRNGFANSVWDPAIQETGVLFGGRGVEAALAEFDTQFTTSVVWGRDEQVQNNLFFAGGLQDGGVLQQDTAAAQAQFQKVTADGSQISVGHNVNYQYNNAPNNLFPSVYTGNVQLSYRKPLWAGSGTEFTRIAGPVSQNIGGLSGVTQGVVIARINNDISIAEFQMAVRNMIKDVEDVYWDLYLAYRRYDAQVVARGSALRTWREVKAKYDIGARGGSAADEAQAKEQYFSVKAQAETELSNIFSTELELRRMIGLSVNDGRVIRPEDEPITAEFIPDWYVALAEGLTRRAELRQQKWRIKSLELQLKAANNLANPRLDFVSAYRVNMFGDQLFGDQDNDVAGTQQGLRSAYEKLTQGDQTGWQLGFQFGMPLGLRSALAQVRNIELQLAKARELLATYEVEVSHELAAAFQALHGNYQTSQTRFNQGRSAQQQLRAFEAAYQVGTMTLDLLLQAQTRLAQAQVAYYTGVIEYNKAITNIQYRKGTLLDYNNVHLAEGAWQPEAYEDALRRAWARSYAIDASNNKHTEPEPFDHYGGVMGTVEFVPSGSDFPPDSQMNGTPMGVDDQNGVVVPPAPAVREDESELPPGDADPGSVLPGLPQQDNYDDDVNTSDGAASFQLFNSDPQDDLQPGYDGVDPTSY